MLDLSAGGSINSLTAKACMDLMSTRAKNDALYNPDLGTEPERSILHISPELMPEVHNTIKEKGIPSELAKEDKTDVLQMLTDEDKIRIEFQEFKYKLAKSQGDLHRIFQRQKKSLLKLIEDYDNISHDARYLGKYLSMTEIQCEQVADAT